jgi:hypothetical protein
MSNLNSKKKEKFLNGEGGGTNFIILDPFEETKVLADFKKFVQEKVCV